MLSLDRLLPILTLVVIYAERMREVRTRRETVPGARKESLTFNLFMICGILMVIGAIGEFMIRGTRLWWPGYLLGVVVSVASFVIRRQAIAALGKFWSLHVEMRDGHEFVQTGPFRWMRHPVYFSMFLELAGLALVSSAFITFAVVMMIFIPTMFYRLKIEEEALLAQFGGTYADYQKRTPLILPWKGPVPP